ncbi:MAG: hypothetical protein HKN46_11145, partial [Acidimicrobiia bacterium]|nr:hypothetical protein [Acidimicrobiia bacterium]
MRSWRLRGLDVLTNRETTGLLGLALLVGVAVGVGGAILIWLVRTASEWVDELIGHGDSAQPLLWLAVVPIALFAAWWIADRWSPESSGGGVPETAAALSVHGGYLSTLSIPIKSIASALTLGGGG